jgi:predicted transcriptional regulator YdeE
MNHSYIVRIYRHEKNNPRMFVGTVERVGEQRKAAFTNIDELWELMNGATGKETKRAKIKEGAREGNCPKAEGERRKEQ